VIWICKLHSTVSASFLNCRSFIDRNILLFDIWQYHVLSVNNTICYCFLFQTQFLIQECTSLLSKPNFVSTLCFAIDSPLHHQKVRLILNMLSMWLMSKCFNALEGNYDFLDCSKLSILLKFHDQRFYKSALFSCLQV